MFKTAKNFFTSEEQALIVQAIKEAELNTSGEIRVHVENYCLGNALNVAKKIFSKLKMHETKDRNGILIYISVLNRKLAVIGDVGIHMKLDPTYWDRIVNEIVKSFKENRKAEGLAKGIKKCGEELKQYFPYQEDDKNELNDSISFNR